MAWNTVFAKQCWAHYHIIYQNANFNLFVSQVPAVKKAEFFKITETTFFS